ncbi:MAG TPA: zinc-dependent alcohol dehydrogenase family protein [Propionibacteriaceae bacterium]|nr:zinc-dependent alcohol dehydrogenase family protein [Propionibacteriaceae bacterium]
MRAWAVINPGPVSSQPLRLVDRTLPTPQPDEILVRVLVCGLCRTDLHLSEGDLAPRRPETIPGHQIVGEVIGAGHAASRFRRGDRVGIAWLRRTCGSCQWCRSGAENLCPQSRYTGWDDDGGFAEFAVAPEAWAYRLPDNHSSTSLAPLLCAGIIGYRSLRSARLPPGGRLGIYGFGSSAHITSQIAAAQGAEVFVMTRGEQNRQLARELGASFVGNAQDQPPEKLDAAIVFAPAGELVPLALESTAPGGTVSLAGIYVSQIPPLDYQRHLFYERCLRSVTANTRRDGEELFRLAARLPIRVHTTNVDFVDLDRAMNDLAHGRASGSIVVEVAADGLGSS